MKGDSTNDDCRVCAKFLADSGATEHLTNSRLIFKTFDESDLGEIECANNDPAANLKTNGVGDVLILTDDGRTHALKDVICAEKLSKNLLSLRTFADMGLGIYLDRERIDIFDPISHDLFITGIYTLLDLNLTGLLSYRLTKIL